MTSLLLKKDTFIERFKRGHSLRFHMSLILLATIGSGLLATRIMLALGLKNVMVRYPLAVVAAYLSFFLAVKLWLKFVVPLTFGRPKTSSNSINVLNVSGSGSSGGSAGSGDGFKGGGGGFGGGGASGSFAEVPAAFAQNSTEAASGAMDTGGGAAGAVGDVAGEAVSSLDLDKGWVVVLVLGLIAAVILGAGVFLIYEAPFILSEAAFQVILAGGLAHGARRMASGDWIGSVFMATWIPLAATLLLALLAGYLMHHFFPGVTRISELFATSAK
ncbi:MAG: hypothetical protein ACHQ2F_09185 [Desulfobaccales bacterium]